MPTHFECDTDTDASFGVQVGHSIYGGGLYSQLIFDESFEDPKDVPPEGRTTPSPTVNSIVSM